MGQAWLEKLPWYWRRFRGWLCGQSCCSNWDRLIAFGTKVLPHVAGGKARNILVSPLLSAHYIPIFKYFQGRSISSLICTDVLADTLSGSACSWKSFLHRVIADCVIMVSISSTQHAKDTLVQRAFLYRTRIPSIQ